MTPAGYDMACTAAAVVYLTMCNEYPARGIPQSAFHEDTNTLISKLAEQTGVTYEKAQTDLLAAFDQLPNNPFAGIGCEEDPDPVDIH